MNVVEGGGGGVSRKYKFGLFDARTSLYDQSLFSMFKFVWL